VKYVINITFCNYLSVEKYPVFLFVHIRDKVLRHMIKKRKIKYDFMQI